MKEGEATGEKLGWRREKLGTKRLLGCEALGE